jgi:SAM-dependent methyltransferase
VRLLLVHGKVSAKCSSLLNPGEEVEGVVAPRASLVTRFSMDLPFSEACERNQHPILGVLWEAFSDRTVVLEIGSGTGQHAAHFARHLRHLTWQPSDLAENIPGIRLRLALAALPNLRDPIVLDIDDAAWPGADALFTANTLHIVSWPRVERLFEGAGTLLPAGGVLAVYGPFNYGGVHTSESNARFDAMLRARDPRSGIRDFEQVNELAERQGFALREDRQLPANNRALVWRKT